MLLCRKQKLWFHRPSQSEIHSMSSLQAKARFNALGRTAGGGAGVDDAIVDGVVDRAPSQNAVFDALATNLAAAESYADSLVVGLLDDRGNYDASGNVFPSSGGSGTAGAILKGDLWTISVAGTLGGHAVTAGDVIRALVNTPGSTDANWAITENNFGYVAENSANKVTSVSGASTDTQYPSAKLLYDQLALKATASETQRIYYGTTGAGSGTAFAATVSPVPAAYVMGTTYTILFGVANSGAATLNLNGLGAVALQLAGAALTPGQIAASSTVDVLYDGAAFQIIDRAAVISSAAGDSTSFAISQTAHGLTIGNSVYYSGTAYAQADRDVSTSTAIGLVSAVADADNFTLLLSGKMTLTTGQWDAITGDSGGLTAGEYYWLSSTAGGITKTAPTTGIKQYIGQAVSTTVMLVALGEPFDYNGIIAFTGRYVDGTAFPGSPIIGWKMFRTDLGLDCYYDGTRWLTVQEYVASGDTATSISAVNTGFLSYSIPNDYSIYVTTAYGTTIAGATNNGSNYYTYAFEWVSAAAARTTLGTFTTAADTASARSAHKVTINTALTSTAINFGYSASVKTGAPSNQTAISVSIRYRLIVT
jgi:hypothetical protein